MAAADPADRVIIARIGGLTASANCVDLSARAATGQRGLEDRFAREIDPDGTMAPAELARRVEVRRRAHMLTLARKSAETRRRRRADPLAAANALRAQRAQPAGGAA